MVVPERDVVPLGCTQRVARDLDRGTLAFLSLRGTVRPPAGDGDAASPGGVTGLLVVDLARGWVVDSRATFQLDGALTAPGGQPRPVRVLVTQRLRVL